MARVSPYLMEAGRAAWSPPHAPPAVSSQALPAPSATVVRAVKQALLSDKTHAEMIAQARRNFDIINTGTSAMEWTLIACLLFGTVAMAWVIFIYWRRGTKIEKA